MKRVGFNIYAHISCANEIEKESGRKELNEAMNKARARDCTYIKYNLKTRVLTFVWCLAWAVDPEPEVLKAVMVYPNGRVGFRTYEGSSNPPIIHGKHLFVNPDDCDFDFAEAQRRWDSYQGQPWLDKKRMGYLQWWRENAGPRIGGIEE